MKYLVIFIILFGIFCATISSETIETGYYHLRIKEKYVSVVFNENNPTLKLGDIDPHHPYSQIFRIKKHSNSLAILWVDSNSVTTYSIGEEKNALSITDTSTRTDTRWYPYQETLAPSWATTSRIRSKYICMYFITRWGRTFSYLADDGSSSISLTRSNPGKDKYTFVEHISGDVLQAISAHKLSSNIYLNIQSDGISCEKFSRVSHDGDEEIESFGVNMFPITVPTSTFKHHGWIPILPEAVGIDDLSSYWIIMNHDDGHLIYQLSSTKDKYYVLVYSIDDDTHSRNWKIGIPTASAIEITTSVTVLREPLKENAFLFISDGHLKIVNNQGDIPQSAPKSTFEFKRTNNPSGSFTLEYNDRYLNLHDGRLLLTDNNIPLWRMHGRHLYYDTERVVLKNNQNVNIHQDGIEESINEPQDPVIQSSVSSEHVSDKVSLKSSELETEKEDEEILEEDKSATQIEQVVSISQPPPVSIRSIHEQESSSNEQAQESEISYSDDVPNFPIRMRELVQTLPHR